MAFLRFGGALRDRADGRVVEAKETADLLQGVLVDADCKVDGFTIRSGTSVHGKSRISQRGSGEVRKRLSEATFAAALYRLQVQALCQRV